MCPVGWISRRFVCVLSRPRLNPQCVAQRAHARTCISTSLSSPLARVRLSQPKADRSRRRSEDPRERMIEVCRVDAGGCTHACITGGNWVGHGHGAPRFKVYALGPVTKRIVSALQALAPERQLNEWFMRIVSEGTDKSFDHEHNARWLEVTRPIVEAFFHARYFLEMAVTYGRLLTAPPRMLPSGWAALLYLYRLR